MWEEDPGWKKVKVTADQCPRIAQDFLDRERRALGESLFAQEYFCEFVQQEDSVFKEEWLCYYDPDELPDGYGNPVVGYCQHQERHIRLRRRAGVGQGRGQFLPARSGAPKLDFRETMDEIKALSKKWPEALSKLVEAQTLGAALSSVLKREVVGIIPIDVRISKVQRAHNCLPLWQTGNVYLPKPHTATWMRDYLRELLNFPQAPHDDCIDATTLALNQWPGGLFPSVKDRLVPITNVQPVSDHEYVIGWVPAHRDDETTVVVYDQMTNAVVRFVRFQADPLLQIDGVHETSRVFNWAIVRAIDG